MIDVGNRKFVRREMLAGVGAAAVLLALPGWAAAAAAPNLNAARRLMRVSADRAFAKLAAPDGFWSSPVARFDLPELFVKGARPVPPTSREQLARRLNVAAEAGARRAGQVARGATGLIKREDAAAVINGEPTAGTSLLRARVGARLINEMVPAIERALRAERDPVVMAAVRRLSGVERVLLPRGAHVRIEQPRATHVKHPGLVEEPAVVADDGELVADAPASRELELQSRLNVELRIGGLLHVFLELP